MYDILQLDLPPLASVGGRVRLPGSKSISNRVLLLAGLADGVTVLQDLLASDDTRVMLDALRTLGCGVDESEDGAMRITGIGGRLVVREAAIFLGNSGTAARSLTAALALLSASQGGRFALSGVPRMHERPIGDLIDALVPLGCPIHYLGELGFPPLQLGDGAAHALQVLRPICVRGNVSSQFLTGLLLALPLVAVAHDIVIEVVGELISKPYIGITLDYLARFGVRVHNDGWRRFVIPAGSRFVSPGELHVEGDASSASYFVALGAIAAQDASLRIEGIGAQSIQGDVKFLDAAQAMGARIEVGANHVDVSRGAWPLRAIALDCNHMPDAAMTLAVMACFAAGTTRLTNIASWRVKETDRIAAMAAELRRLGASVTEGDDFMAVEPPVHWQAATIRTYDDHRIAMCFSIAAFNGLSSDGTGMPVRILDPRCVGKTYPDYFETLFAIARTDVKRIPVLTIDGPSASGKGTVAGAVAAKLGYHFLDSGAVYRATALATMRAGLTPQDDVQLAALASSLDLRFDAGLIYLGGEEVSDLLRGEDVGSMASKVSAVPAVRQALRDLQLSFRRLPGLVADGRDMGTVIFPGADVKVFMSASAAERAARRHRQLISKGIASNIADLRAELEARDIRDQTRAVSPLKPADDAVLLDNSHLTIEASVAAVLDAWQRSRPFPLDD